MRNLHDYQLRLLNNSVSLPSGHDVANTLKYFSQTLLGECSPIFPFPTSNRRPDRFAGPLWDVKATESNLMRLFFTAQGY